MIDDGYRKYNRSLYFSFHNNIRYLNLKFYVLGVRFKKQAEEARKLFYVQRSKFKV